MTIQEMTLKDYQKNMARKRRINILVLAALKRAKDAGIPEDFMRISKDEFKPLLCPVYAQKISKTIDDIADLIYDRPEEIFKKYQFILIDGGTKVERKMAGLAILFRLIASDHGGKYELFDSFVHSLEDPMNTVSFSRSAYIDEMSLHDLLFISEFDKEKFNLKKDAGSFVDEILETRENNKRTTIISFSNSLSDPRSEITENDRGLYFYNFSKYENMPIRNVMRIKVRVMPKGDV